MGLQLFIRPTFRKQLVSVSIVAFMFLQALSASAASLELLCPCSAEATSATAVELRAGARNTGTTASAAVRLRLLVHDRPSFLDSSFNSVSTRTLNTTLSANASIGPLTLSAGFVPTQRAGFSTLVLEELESGNWVRRDSIRLFEPVAVDTAVGGALPGSDSAFPGAVHFTGTPTISVSGSTATINLPQIVNDSPSVGVGGLTLQLRQTAAPDIFGSAFVVGNASIPGSIAPLGSVGAQQITLNLSSAQGRFVHLILRDAFGTLLAYETLIDSAASLASRDFFATSVELLTDSDTDGVSDFNERFSGTDPQSAGSVPGPSVVDLLVLYSPGVSAAHNGDALARIEHLIAVTNQVYQDSGVNMRVRLALAQQRNLNESIGNTTLINQMFAESGVFAGLQAFKESIGADIVVAMRPIPPGDPNCGIANLGAVGFDGDFSSVSNANRAIATMYSNCRDRTMPHELGHVMGLNHSRIENDRLGTGATFDWSTGHGVQNNFATVMAGINDFGGTQAREVNVFSNPNLSCAAPNKNSAPCGVSRENTVDGADAASSLNATRFQVAAFTPPDNEFGDSPATALTAPVNGELIQASLSSPQDLDYFAITAIAGRSYEIETTQLAAGLDTRIEVSRGAAVIAQDDNGGNGAASNLTFVATSDGVHFIRVNHVGGALGGYSLRVVESSAEVASNAVLLVSAVLPTSRSVELGNTATAFVTMINGGSQQARNCSIVPETALPLDFSFQPTDPATNALIGTPNQPMSLDPGAAQTFLVSMHPTVAFDTVEMRLRYVCDNSAPAAALTGINTLSLSASETAVPDVVALAATTTGDGVARVPPGFFSLATVNVGSTGTVSVTADTGLANLPLSVSLCETNPTTGACVNPAVPAASLVTQAPAGGTQTFAVFLSAAEAIALDPARSRVFVRFTDASGVVRGATSVALQATP